MDFAGTDAAGRSRDQLRACYTYAMATYGVKVCTSPNLPNNEGMFRPITRDRAGRLHRQSDIPGRRGGSRMLIGHYVPMLVFGCARPDRAGPGDGGVRHRRCGE